jgi:hypothetical protein
MGSSMKGVICCQTFAMGSPRARQRGKEDPDDRGGVPLESLRQDRHHGWHYFLTGDESSFLYGTDFERMSLLEGEIPPSRPRTIASTQKLMISRFWSPTGFPVIAALQPRTNCTPPCFCDDHIPKIVSGIPSDLTRFTPTTDATYG